MSNRLDEFKAYRVRMNERIGEIDHLGIKRFFNLDSAVYRDGPLEGKTKELLGLVASTVLRCIAIPQLRHTVETIDLARAG